MADFKKAIQKILAYEAGYANHPADRGGETYKGIARKKNPEWSGWQIIDAYKNLTNMEYQLEMDEELQERVIHFYKVCYWDPVAGDFIINQEVAEELLDIAINQGAGTAARFLQKTINLLNKNNVLFQDVETDGKIGIKTYNTLNKYCNPKSVIKCLNGYQWERYKDICAKDPSQEVFFSGWLTRV